MVCTQFGDTTLFSVHSDDAPTVYVNGTAAQPLRDQTDPVVRSLEREMAGLSWLNPYTNAVENNIMVALADHTEMKTLHMVTADPFRTPTFTPFADPDWFFFATGGARRACDARPRARSSRRGRRRASRGTTATSRTRSPRPGSATSGRASSRTASTATTWSDHTDLRPTILTLLGLKDDYTTTDAC